MSDTIRLEMVTPDVRLELGGPEIRLEMGGPAGPNQVTSDTTTDLTGILKGVGGQIAAAVAGVDYSTYSSASFSTDFAAKDTDDLAEGSTNLFSKWEEWTDEGSTFLTPADATNQLSIGALSDVSALGTFSLAPAIFSSAAETNYFLNYAAGTTSFLNGGALFAGLRSQGTPNAPTAIGASYGLGGFTFLGHDGTSFATGSDGVTLPGLYIMGDIVSTNNIRQTWHLLGGVNASSVGVVSMRSDNRLGFFRTAPVARDGTWTVSNPVTNRTIDVSAATLAQTRQILGTLITALKTYGLLG
jgi:hypothetical protein